MHAIACSAEKIGVAPNTFHGYESGKHDPKSDLLVMIAQECKVSVDYLLGLSKIQQCTEQIPPDEELLIFRFRQLNQAGKNALLEHAELLTGSSKYTEQSKIQTVQENLA